jgi:hypothetical protein
MCLILAGEMTNVERECLTILYRLTSIRDETGFDLAERHPKVIEAVESIISFGKIHHPRVCNDAYLDSVKVGYGGVGEVSGLSSFDIGETSNVWNRVRGEVKVGDIKASDTRDVSIQQPRVKELSAQLVKKKDEESGIDHLVAKHLQDITELDDLASRILDTSSLMLNTEYHRVVTGQPDVSRDWDFSRIRGVDEVRKSSLASPERRNVDGVRFCEGLKDNSIEKSGVLEMSPVNSRDADVLEKSPIRMKAPDDFETSPVRLKVPDVFELSHIRIETINDEQSPARLNAYIGSKKKPDTPSFDLLTPTRVTPTPRENLSEYLSEEDSVLQKMLAPQTPVNQGEMHLDEFISPNNIPKVDLTHLFSKVGSVHENRHFDQEMIVRSEESISLSEVDETSLGGKEDLLEELNIMLLESKEGKIDESDSNILLDSNGKSRGIISTEPNTIDSTSQLQYVSALDSYLANSSLSLNGPRHFVRSKLRSTMETILNHLEFSDKQRIPCDYRRHLDARERFDDDPGLVVCESLNPILRSVFKLDLNLMLVICRVIVVEYDEGAPRRQWTVGLVEIHRHL